MNSSTAWTAPLHEQIHCMNGSLHYCGAKAALTESEWRMMPLVHDVWCLWFMTHDASGAWRMMPLMHDASDAWRMMPLMHDAWCLCLRSRPMASAWYCGIRVASLSLVSFSAMLMASHYHWLPHIPAQASVKSVRKYVSSYLPQNINTHSFNYVYWWRSS